MIFFCNRKNAFKFACRVVRRMKYFEKIDFECVETCLNFRFLGKKSVCIFDKMNDSEKYF